MQCSSLARCRSTGAIGETTVVLGDRDPETPARDILDWPHEGIEVIAVPGGDHLLPPK